MSIPEVAQTIGAAIAIRTLILCVYTARNGLVEFKRDNSLKRVERFENMRKRYDGNEKLQKVVLALKLKYKLAQNSFNLVKDLGYIEDVALLNNAGILNDDATFYVFGWDALLAYETDEFWATDIDRSEPYWGLFKACCEKMKCYRAKYPKRDWPVADLIV
jgi:hypothetical protein